MRRRNTAQPYDDEFLRAPGAAYHTSAQQQRHRGPKSLPPSRTFEDSPNASPSSSTDGGLERSFHSEFIPSSQPSTSRRRNKKHRIPASDFYPSRDERNNKYLKEESDSESARIMVEEEMYNAMKQIKKYRTGLSEAIGKYRQIKTDFDKLLKEKHSLAFSMIEKDHKIQQLESEIAQLSQEKRSLEIENQSLKSIGYSYAGPQHRYHHHYPPTYPQPPTHYSYMTPPSQIRSTQFNNTNTGSVMASGGGERNSNNNNNFRGPRHRVVEHLFGNINDGSGEQLAFLSANTTASQVVLPGIPIIPNNTDDINDEIKNFRVADESSPSRPRKYSFLFL
uniref:Uncharacterized protein n=1 Tax=Panagrolaimus superbus TaxID=310955 RepID=A0A914Y6W3_9BILA